MNPVIRPLVLPTTLANQPLQSIAVCPNTIVQPINVRSPQLRTVEYYQQKPF